MQYILNVLLIISLKLVYSLTNIGFQKFVREIKSKKLLCLQLYFRKFKVQGRFCVQNECWNKKKLCTKIVESKKTNGSENILDVGPLFILFTFNSPYVGDCIREKSGGQRELF